MIPTRAQFLFPMIAVASLSACDSYPRDIDGTLAAVKRDKVIRVGVVATGMSAQARAIADGYLRRVAAATGALPHMAGGSAEPLLAQLEQGQLDLVIGDFAIDTPWMDDVAVIEPIGRYRIGKRELGLSPVARNGENAWIMLLERAARDTGGSK